MHDLEIILPSQPKVVQEDDTMGIYEIDGLYPGYGHTLGNSLRRIILSSISGSAITSVKIEGVEHEFSTLSGVKEDVIALLLNLKQVRIRMLTDESQVLNLKIKGIKDVTAGDIEAPGQVEILNKDLYIAALTDKNAELSIEMRVEKGIGYVPKEVLHKDRVEVGVISLDAIFTPIERVSYEVENMRVGDRTDFNRLRISIKTDGIVTPHEALKKAVAIMINQLKAIVGFQEEVVNDAVAIEEEKQAAERDMDEKDFDTEVLKTRIDSMDGFSARTANALANANIRTVGGLVRKCEEDILAFDGMGVKGLDEIKFELKKLGVSLKD